ncbi:Uma2 family endonuclease, partial [bacterium]
MAGASANHRAITPRLSFAIQKRLQPGECRYFDQDTKIFVDATGSYYYADGGVACPPRIVNRPAGAIDNPTVIFEVMSPSSELADRGAKFDDYATLSSLREYVLIGSNSANVQVFRRESEDEWHLTVYSGLDRVIFLTSLDMKVPLEELYADVDFEVQVD